MPAKENTISYQTTNSYSTLNSLSENTNNIWIACHGLGYLSRYFVRYFHVLHTDENYVICPQAPSKYYQGNGFKYVGASWLTKEQTALETENVLNYLDAMYRNERNSFENKRIILMGYSQGVSVVMRWMSKRNIACNDLVIHSGSIPKELKTTDFDNHRDIKVHLIYGNKDEYINDDKLKHQLNFAKTLFPNQLKVYEFEGKHEVNSAILKKIAES